MEISANILRILNNNLKTPAFILDQYGELLALNENARKLYSPDLPVSSFWALFIPESIPNVKKSFNDSVLSNKSLVESTTIVLQNNEKKNVEITFSGLGENGNKLILCTFDFDFPGIEKLKFTIKSEELKNIIKSDEFVNIFEEIRSSFPFTLLGKSKIRNEIDKLEDFFWLKDIEGKYLLVNNKFARNLGLKSAQLEGKYEKEFLPKYLSGFFDAVDEFIQSTSNIVIREGLTQPVSSDLKNLRVVEFPLCDLDNRAIAIIGIAQDITNLDRHTSDGLDVVAMINALNGPAAILNLSGDILISNQRFSVFLNELSNGDKEEVDHLIKFLCSNLNNSSDITQEVKKSLTNKNVSFVFNVGKLYNSNKNFNRFLLQVNKFSEDVNIEILLNNREKMYEIIMQASPEPMFIYDIENLRFLEVNKAALDMYGYSRKELLQMDLTDLYAPEDIQTLLGSGNHGSKEGVFTGPWRHKKRDGSSILVEISKVTFEYKKSKAHFNIIRDVTEKIELNKELQLYKNIFENTSDMIFITDSEGFITFANNAVLATLGYNNEELDTRPIITLVTDDFRSELNNIFYSTEKVSSLSEIEFKNKEGSIVKLNLNFTPVFDYNEQIGSYNIIAKISQNSDKVAKSDNIKSAAVQSVSTIDTTLLSSMFHEILTPINVILGFVQEITENFQDPNEEIKEASEIINQNRQVLLQTMDSILEYSHIEQNRVELKTQKMFFTDILDNLQKNTKKTADSNKIEFSYGKISSSLNIETDSHRMESLLTMFITAAMRITKEKTIYISAYQYDDMNYIISLKDNRRDISAYLAESLYQVFSNDIYDLKKDYGISKLSIHLARKLIKILNGQFQFVKKSGEVSECGIVFPLEFSSEITEGKFSKQEIRQTEIEKEPEPVPTQLKEEITSEPESIISEREILIYKEENLPEKYVVKKPEPEIIPQVASTEKTHKQSGKHELTGLQCLYVEDQIDSQILFKVQMKELKHIDFAVSFEAALPLLEQNKYDFIIMDINLQGEYNGLDALRIIRRLPGYNNTQIIAVTAYVLPGDKEKFIAAGFNDFISKPILREKLIDSINKILN